MKEKKEFTIVYVFGPEKCAEKYGKDGLLTLENGEWVKIGETNYIGNIDRQSIKEHAMKRIHKEERTGIPVTCKLYDIYLFPKKSHTDNMVRGRLCSDLFNLESSKQTNKQLKEDKEIIKAGVEFVYGACRSKIKYAVQSVDHDLIAEAKDDEHIKLIAELCKFNNIDIDNNREGDNSTQGIRSPRLELDLILQVGAEVTLTRDGKRDIVMDENNDPITAKYIGDNRFECRGETGRSSGFAKKYLNDYGGKNLSTVNGNEYWTYNGQKLTSLRKN